MAMRGRAAYVRGRALNLTNMWNRLTMTGSEANKAAYAKRIKRILSEEKRNATCYRSYSLRCCIDCTYLA